MSQWLAARNILAVRLDNAGDVIMPDLALSAVKETSPEEVIAVVEVLFQYTGTSMVSDKSLVLGARQ